MNHFLFAICFFKLSVAASPLPVHFWLIWNVGQGQWVTRVETDTCTHFDFGGENFALEKIRPLFLKYCAKKQNRLHLSHADLDHYSFYNFIQAHSKSTCWLNQPLDELRQIKFDVGLCATSDKTVNSFDPPHEITKNDSSSVVTSEHFLIPGDSSQKMEKIWARQIRPSIFLILGHHGSRTSTGDFLLKSQPDLQMAFASARFRKYGHPHKETVQRLRKFHIPLIKTEDFGTIRLE